MTSNSNLKVISLLLSFIFFSCKKEYGEVKEIKKTRIQVLEYKSDLPIEGAGVGFVSVTSYPIPWGIDQTWFQGNTDIDGYCDVPDMAIMQANMVVISKPNYYLSMTKSFNSVTVFKMDLIGNVKIHLVDTIGFGMTCRLYIYAERPASFYADLDFWELRSLPEGPISADYSFDSQAFGGQINNLQIINDLADTINNFVNVSRTDTTFVEIKY